MKKHQAVKGTQETVAPNDICLAYDNFLILYLPRFNLPGEFHVAVPNLASQFAVAVFGGRALPSMAGNKRDCAVDLKSQPLTRLRKAALGKNKIAAGDFVVSVSGVRKLVPPTVFIN